MSKYIDADKLIAGIDKLRAAPVPQHDQQCDFSDGYSWGLNDIENIIDSLQQEQLDVDLNEEIYSWLECGGLIYPMSNKERINIKNTARNFYELGLSTRK